MGHGKWAFMGGQRLTSAWASWVIWPNFFPLSNLSPSGLLTHFLHLSSPHVIIIITILPLIIYPPKYVILGPKNDP